jgi:phosphate:Na+ symporter
LDALRLSLETSSRNLTSDLAEMIRSGQLAPDIATSMMNDESYAFDI